MQLDLFNITNIRAHFKIAILICLVLTIYLPGLNSGFFIFDDYGMVNSLKGISLRESLNFFNYSGGRYWRPLIGISFLFDISLSNSNSSWMHLHNILLHATNTVLVFFIVQLILSQQKQSYEWPLFAAVLFAVHPVNTEPVNWISGRTDLLASVFSLAGVYLFLFSIRINKPLFSWASAVFILLGCMAKEVAFALFPAIFISLLIVRDWPFVPKSHFSLINVTRRGLPFLVGGGTYLWLRRQAFVSFDQGLGKIIEVKTANSSLLIEQAQTCLVALGFYLKKLFIPAPLNFAIDNVGSVYLSLGLITVLVCSYIMLEKSLTSALVLYMMFTIAPAILNAVFHIAWTPYAERYLYLPSAFLCISLCFCIATAKSLTRRRTYLVPLLFLCFLGLTTYRNLQWMQPEKILADAIRQNPDNLKLRINNALVLANTIGPETGRDELNQVIALEPTNQAARRNLAMISLQLENAPEQARKDLDLFFSDAQVPDAQTLSTMVEVNEIRLEQAPVETAQIIKKELFETYRKYYLLAGDPAYLFSAGIKATTTYERQTVRVLLDRLIEDPTVKETDRSKANALLAVLSIKTSE